MYMRKVRIKFKYDISMTTAYLQPDRILEVTSDQIRFENAGVWIKFPQTSKETFYPWTSVVACECDL